MIQRELWCGNVVREFRVRRTSLVHMSSMPVSRQTLLLDPSWLPQLIKPHLLVVIVSLAATNFGDPVTEPSRGHFYSIVRSARCRHA